MPGDPRAGFSLLEVLVAFAVLALALSVALPLLGQGFRATEAAERYAAALAVAESRLAELAAARPFRAGELAGEAAGGYRWRASVQPYERDAALLAGRPAFEAFELVVTVAWDDARPSRAVRLATVRLQQGEGLR